MKVPRKSTIIDSVFYRPPEVIDFKDDDSASISSSRTAAGGFGTIIIGDDPTVTPPAAFSAVTFMHVVSQTMKANADGTHTVDVLVEVDDIPGVTSYEVRLTRQ